MNARDKAYTGAAAAFRAPHQPNYPTEREIQAGKEVLRILDNYTDAEFAAVLMGCLMVLGERLNEKSNYQDMAHCH